MPNLSYLLVLNINNFVTLFESKMESSGNFPIPKGHVAQEFPTPQEAQEKGLNPVAPEMLDLSSQPSLRELTHANEHQPRKKWTFKTEHLDWRMMSVLSGLAATAGYACRQYLK